MKNSSESNERHGLLARIIENWLTNINERQYQLPFCQVLAAEGETILYVSSHGPFEKGKDIITRTASGEIRAYQLKANDIGLAEWRDIYGEIVNLVELAVELPSLGVATEFAAYLVTNGDVTDPVLEQIRSANVSWHARGVKNVLRVIQKGELLERFQSSHGAYLPRQLTDFTTFLGLVLRDGSFVAEKNKAAQLLEGILPTPANGHKAGKLDILRAAASAVLLTAYITRAAQDSNNYWAVFEYWVVAASYILRLAEEYEVSEDRWEPSFRVCELSADRALESLMVECETRPNLVEGSPLTDGFAYASRMTVLAGLLAAMHVRQRIARKPLPKAEFVMCFIQKNLRNAVSWGESAVPYFALVSLAFDSVCMPFHSEALMIQLIGEISSQNRLEASGRGLPNVYYSPEESLRLSAGLDPLNEESFVGYSYEIETLVDMLARRWRRQALASLWSSITRIAFATYVPRSPGEWFRWKSMDGALETHFAGEPQSWMELLHKAETRSYDGVPQTLIKRPEFAVLFALVYPHRFTPSLAKLIEDAALHPSF